MSIVSQAVGEREAKAQAPAFAACLRNGTHGEAQLGEFRDALAELNRRSARLLMAELGGGPESASLARAVRDREHRLSVVIEAAARTLQGHEAASGLGTGEPEPGAPQRVADEGELAELQASILALAVAVDAVVADPASDRSLSELDQRLGELESRLGCQAIERASHPELARAGLARGWKAPSNPPIGVTSEAVPVEPQAAGWGSAPLPSPLGSGSAVGRARDPGVAAELGVLARRVRRLEGQLRLTFVLLVLTAGLAAFGLWRLHGSDDGSSVRPAELEQRPASPPAIERVMGAGPPDSLAPRGQGTEQGAAAGAGIRESEGPVVRTDAAAETESPAADRSADDPTATQANPGIRDTRPEALAPLAGALAVPAAIEDLPPVVQLADDGSAVTVLPPAADRAVARSSDALVLNAPSYAIQLIAFRDKEPMLGYVEERGLADRALYGLSSAGGSRWHVVVLGFYPTRADARAAADDLPETLRRLDPWIRQFPAGSRFERFDQGVALGGSGGSSSRP